MKSDEQRYAEKVGLDVALKKVGLLQHKRTVEIIADCLTCGEVLYKTGQVETASIYLYKGIHCLLHPGHKVRILKIFEELIQPVKEANDD